MQAHVNSPVNKLCSMFSRPVVLSTILDKTLLDVLQRIIPQLAPLRKALWTDPLPILNHVQLILCQIPWSAANLRYSQECLANNVVKELMDSII